MRERRGRGPGVNWRTTKTTADNGHGMHHTDYRAVKSEEGTENREVRTGYHANKLAGYTWIRSQEALRMQNCLKQLRQSIEIVCMCWSEANETWKVFHPCDRFTSIVHQYLRWLNRHTSAAQKQKDFHTDANILQSSLVQKHTLYSQRRAHRHAAKVKHALPEWIGYCSYTFFSKFTGNQKHWTHLRLCPNYDFHVGSIAKSARNHQRCGEKSQPCHREVSRKCSQSKWTKTNRVIISNASRTHHGSIKQSSKMLQKVIRESPSNYRGVLKKSSRSCQDALNKWIGSCIK